MTWLTAAMLLNVVESGAGEACAVLLHGMMGSAESWHRVAPVLANSGYRVLAIDLPGHGLSPRDPHLTFDGALQSVIDTVRAAAGRDPVVAIGHSYGGLLLAAAAPLLRPEVAVYVDTPFTLTGGQDGDALTARYERDRRRRTPAWLLRTRPHYGENDAAVEGRAAERFDPSTSASLSTGRGGSWPPAPGSIVVRADPSDYVGEGDVRRLAAAGVQVRSIAGAAHTVWYSHFDEFISSLPEVFRRRGADVGRGL
jgi:pimeloyl-ACP methyl ester carboxylesterase